MKQIVYLIYKITFWAYTKKLIKYGKIPKITNGEIWKTHLKYKDDVEMMKECTAEMLYDMRFLYK